jgi:hypothetical protein
VVPSPLLSNSIIVIDAELRVVLQSVPINLLPGPPVRAGLEDGHPFVAAGPMDARAAEGFEPGAALPPFTARVLDAFGNACVPSPALTWSVEVQSEGVAPTPAFAEPDAGGGATFQNVAAARSKNKDADGGCPVAIRVVPSSHVAGLQTAVALASEEACRIAEAPAADGAHAVMAPGPVPQWRILLAPSDAPGSFDVVVGDHNVPNDTVEVEGVKRQVFHVRTCSECSHSSYSQHVIVCDASAAPSTSKTARCQRRRITSSVQFIDDAKRLCCAAGRPAGRREGRGHRLCMLQ